MAGEKALTPEDVLSFKLVADAQLSPDGDVVAFVVGDSFKTDGKYQKSNLWTVSAGGGDARQLTGGPRSATSPRWSPDGETLAFLSDRAEDGQRQVYLLPTGGGEALRASDVEGSISRGLSWSPDGKSIAFLMTDPETKDEKRRKDEKDDVIEFEKHPKYTRLYVMEVESGSVSCVSPDGLQVWEFCWSPSGEEVAAVASDLPFEQAWYTCRLVRFSLSGGPATTLHQSKRQVARPVWSPDGNLIAFLSSNWSDQGVVGGGVFVILSDGGDARELSASHIASASWLHWTDDSQRLITAAHEQGGIGLAEIDVSSGRRTSLWSGEAVFAEPQRPQFSMDREGNFAVVREDGENPRDVWLASPAATGLEWRQLTQLHPQAEELDIASTETVRWRGADGWEMQGLLLRPPGATTDERQPMVTVVHGGPTSVHGHQYYAGRQWFQLLATQGIAVFLPNPRGSTGWGLEFAESNIGDMGGKDWEDIQLGVDHCVAERIADPDRLGIAGWSYGGFMTAWAVTQTERFKAAMMGAGIADWRSFHGRSYLCDWDAIHYGDADPWDPDGTFKKFSPITYVKNARTPTLIVHGAQDGDVPVEQSFLFYRALQDLGVESELVMYPREPHGLQERNHMLDLGRRITEWFVKHLEP
jgi:dipeptidyl aminopeptidase/acylaminoacyl peptidase